MHRRERHSPVAARLLPPTGLTYSGPFRSCSTPHPEAQLRRSLFEKRL